MLALCFRTGRRALHVAIALAGVVLVLILGSAAVAQGPHTTDNDRAVVVPAQPMPTPDPVAMPPGPETLPTVGILKPPVDTGEVTTIGSPKKLISGFTPSAMLIPQKPPRSAADVHGFFEDVNGTDGMVEVVLGVGRLLTLRQDLSLDRDHPRPLIAIGDPGVLRVVPVSTRQLRLIGLRFGMTDLSITTWDNRVYTLQVQVVADLDVLRVQLRALYPDASLSLSQVHDHLVVDGEARDASQIARILETIKAYVISLQASAAQKFTGESTGGTDSESAQAGNSGTQVASIQPGAGAGRERVAAPQEAGPAKGKIDSSGTIPPPQIINLLHVPGPQQVMLKVRIAEMNRTALRQIGSDILGVDTKGGAIGGTQIGGAGISALATLTGAGLIGEATGAPSSATSVFAIFQRGEFEVLLSALRRNSILKVLAEPNVVAMNGQVASFLAGGEFPVPVPQTTSGGGAPAVTVSFQEFGVRLGFLPFILDHDRIRLTVDPEVSSVDFTIGTVLVPGGSPVPGLNTRKVHTTVELRQGETLAIAGLMQLTLDGSTSRIPGLGDLPYIGPFFSNTSNSRIEKELVVLITPYLVEPMNACQIPPLPGDEVGEPNDLESYLLGHIVGTREPDFRSTAQLNDPLHIHECMHLEDHYVQGPHGFCDQ